jgi:DnaK suppressor protein
MEPEMLEEFRKILLSRKAELLSEATHTVAGMTSDTSLYADPVDRALLESNRNFTLRLRDRERKLIRKLDEAIARVDAGTFGNCEICGEPIETSRLRARPVTTLCIDCKEEQERLEKMEL